MALSVIGRAHEHLYRQVLAGLESGVSLVGLHFIQNAGIIHGIGNHRDGRVILGGGTEHGRAADVDLFNGFLQCHVRPGYRFFKGVQVHADQVDGLDAVFLRLADVLLHCRGGAAGRRASIGCRVLRRPSNNSGSPV